MEQSGKRILIVDDERRIADAFAIILTQQKYIAVAAYNGSTALAMAEAWQFDVALIDVVMPIMDGFETARRLKALLPCCEVLLSSGHEVVLHQLREEFQILTKPVHPEDLLELLRTLPN